MSASPLAKLARLHFVVSVSAAWTSQAPYCGDTPLVDCDASEGCSAEAECGEALVSLVQQDYALVLSARQASRSRGGPDLGAPAAERLLATNATPADEPRPLILTNVQGKNYTVPTMFKLLEQGRLVNQALSWEAAATLEEQRLGGTQIGRPLSKSERAAKQAAQRAAEAAAFDAGNFSRGELRLFNPSMIELPPSWRRSGERWLGVFRHTTYREGIIPSWFSSYIVLATMDLELRPLRPLKVLGSLDFFPEVFDCLLDNGEKVSYFGPEDARLFLSPTSASEPKVFLFFSGRAHAPHANVPCRWHGGQRMFISEVGRNLDPIRTSPLLVSGESGMEDVVNLNLTGARSHAVHRKDHGISASELQHIEKNWAPFIHWSQQIKTSAVGLNGSEQLSWSNPQDLIEYSVEPHVVMDVNFNGSRVGGRYLWNTSSDLVAQWQESLLKNGEQLHGPVHGGVGAIRIRVRGHADVFLSVLHQRIRKKKAVEYRSALYAFEAAPPFRILGVGANLLPLQAKTCVWGGVVAFPLGLVLDDSPRAEPDLWVLYGRGDSESHRLRLGWKNATTYLPAKLVDPTGLTMVMMSHSRKRLADLKAIIRIYRAIPADILEEILIIWNDPKDQATPREIEALNAESVGVTLRVLDARVNSMNNRFAVWEAVRTEGVIIQDDDMWVSPADIARLVDAWRSNNNSLVGAFVEREHYGINNAGRLEELSPHCKRELPNETVSRPHCVFWGKEFSMLLPHPWVVATKYLKLYMEGRAMTKLVDDMVNCDDIYFNAVVSNASRLPPIALDVTVHRFPRWRDSSSMWGTDQKWAEHRSRCLEEVNSFYAHDNAVAGTGVVWRLASGPAPTSGAHCSAVSAAVVAAVAATAALHSALRFAL